MGRPAKGLRVKYKRGWAYAHFTWEHHPYRLALGLQKGRTAEERRAVEAAAARAYAQVVNGERRAVRRAPGKLLDLAELLDEWLESKRPSLDVKFFPTVESYARRYVDYFERLDKITEATGEQFGIARLGQALRKTVNRELSYLREFLRWCKRHGALAFVPNIPRLPAKAQGVRAGKQRAKFVHVTPAQAAEILALLPKQSKTIDGRKWPLRARFEFAWETGLRPGTIGELRVPDHWRPGSRILEIPNEDDKARFGREVDLTDRAIAILKAVAPARGVIFGHHAFYKAIKKAAAAVLGPIKGKSFAPYDFRHGRAKELLDAGAPIRGVSYVLGHKLISTTNIYVAPERSAGQEALAAAGGYVTPNDKRTQSAPARRRAKR
jgi:integrase